MATRSVCELQTVLFPLVDGFNELAKEPYRARRLVKVPELVVAVSRIKVEGDPVVVVPSIDDYRRRLRFLTDSHELWPALNQAWYRPGNAAFSPPIPSNGRNIGRFQGFSPRRIP